MSDYTDKIAAALALADSAITQAEAENAMAMAQKLATFSGIDLEQARRRQKNRDKREVPDIKTVTVGALTPRGRGAPGNKYFVWLMSRIAAVNDVKVDIAHRANYTILYGLPSDIAVCEALFTTIQAQMVRFCLDDIAQNRHKAEGVNARAYKNHFYEGFVYTIGHRLREARQEAIAEQKARDEAAAALLPAEEAAEAASTPGGELVLREKAEEVFKFYKTKSTARGSWTEAGSSAYGGSAHSSGRAAAQRTNLTPTRGALPGQRRQIAG